ncbi:MULTISPECIES: DUF4184 family protein [unclassified Nocardiopsis]|uniref:DUF4184 family protein n=1 Tax=Nocardiopsis sp. FR26 TaxID=2605987 RepID=UPI001F164C0F|nr:MULTISPECIES: DUF4184 family protein [unclassified Nocardiopsis]
MWDAFTHPLGLGVQLLPVLRTPLVEPHKLFNVLVIRPSWRGSCSWSREGSRPSGAPVRWPGPWGCPRWWWA